MWKYILNNVLILGGAIGVIAFDIFRTIDPSIDWNGFRGLASSVVLLGIIVKLAVGEHQANLLRAKNKRFEDRLFKLEQETGLRP